MSKSNSLESLSICSIGDAHQRSGEGDCGYAAKYPWLNPEWSFEASTRTKAHNRNAAPSMMAVAMKRGSTARAKKKIFT
jgi:hypothetical protein